MFNFGAAGGLGGGVGGFGGGGGFTAGGVLGNVGGLGTLGGAAAGGVAAGPPGFGVDSAPPKEGLSPPSALQLINLNAATDRLLAGEGLGDDEEAEGAVVARMIALRLELRRADPSSVQLRTNSRAQRLHGWLREDSADGSVVVRPDPLPGQPPAEWDGDTPDHIKQYMVSNGTGVTRDWSCNQVRRLAEEVRSTGAAS